MHESTRQPQEKVCGYEYTVRRGDSLYLIANRLGVPLRDLLAANPDVNPARLMIGDVLCIPMEEDDAPQITPEAPATPTPLPETPIEPTEPIEPDESGDDLDVPAIPEAPTEPEAPGQPETSACPAENQHTVLEGETAADIQLRRNLNRYTLQQANPDADLDHLTPGAKLCVPSVNSACPAAATYRLQAEDTIESAALRLNTSLAALLRANPCLAPGDFTEGRCIWVPDM